MVTRDLPGRRTTMADIADEAGVSISTVSKVLNGRSDVGPETRARVQRLLGRRGFAIRGRGDRPPGAGLVEFVINELTSPWAVELIRGAEEVIQAAGMGLVVSAIHGRSPLARQWLRALANRGSRGAILVVSELSGHHEAELRGDYEVGAAPPEDIARMLVTLFQEMRAGVTKDGKTKVRTPNSHSRRRKQLHRETVPTSARCTGYQHRQRLCSKHLPFQPTLPSRISLAHHQRLFVQA